MICALKERAVSSAATDIGISRTHDPWTLSQPKSLAYSLLRVCERKNKVKVSTHQGCYCSGSSQVKRIREFSQQKVIHYKTRELSNHTSLMLLIHYKTRELHSKTREQFRERNTTVA